MLRYSNGLMCYTCDIFNKDCSNIVTCSGDQKKCFSTKGDYSLHTQSAVIFCMNRTAPSKYSCFSIPPVCTIYSNISFFFFPVDIIGMNTKGCASDIICGNSVLNTLGSIPGTQMTCCEGILCNSAQGLKQSLFLLLVTLLSLLFLWDVPCFWFSGLLCFINMHKTLL